MSDDAVRSRPLSGVAAAAVLMRLSWRRLFRNKSFWLSVILAALPILFLATLAGRWDGDQRWSRTVGIAVIPLLGILVPLNLAPVIAEEAEDDTFSYLWSRPFPRWAVLAGKGAALAPFCLGLFVAAAAVVWAISYGGGESWRLVRAVVALGCGVAGAGAASVGLGLLIRRQAVAVSAGYLLVVDLPLGKVPLSIANLSITHHVSRIAAAGAGSAASAPGLAVPLMWIAGMTALWLALAVWRIERVELGSK